MSKVKVAILTTRFVDQYDHYADHINVFMPLHITEWEEVDQGKVHEINQGLNILNEQNKNTSHGMAYRLFVNDGGTSDMILRSMAAYQAKLKEGEERRLQAMEKDRMKREKAAVNQALRKKAKTIKNAINALELTGGNIETLNGLREELRMLEDSKKKKATA